MTTNCAAGSFKHGAGEAFGAWVKEFSVKKSALMVKSKRAAIPR